MKHCTFAVQTFNIVIQESLNCSFSRQIPHCRPSLSQLARRRPRWTRRWRRAVKMRRLQLRYRQRSLPFKVTNFRLCANCLLVAICSFCGRTCSLCMFVRIRSTTYAWCMHSCAADECSRDLAAAEPVIQEAEAALNSLEKSSLGELKSFGSPAAEIVQVLAACMVLCASGGSIPKDLRSAIQQVGHLCLLVAIVKLLGHDTPLPKSNGPVFSCFVVGMLAKSSWATWMPFSSLC